MDFMSQVVQQLINGVSLGSIYALIALGYTMVYGIIKLINFAHGDIYMVGAYIGFFAVAQAGLGIFPALVISMVVTGLIGCLVERDGFRGILHIHFLRRAESGSAVRVDIDGALAADNRPGGGKIPDGLHDRRIQGGDVFPRIWYQRD